jgi:hypothetical protein
LSSYTVDNTNKPLSGSSPIKGALTPADLSDAYNLTGDIQPSGTVAIVDAYDDPSAEQDMNAYRRFYGLPQCTSQDGCFRKVNQDGQAGPLPPSAKGRQDIWHLETSLDLDMVSAACPKCSLLLVETDGPSGLYKGVDTAAKLGAAVISTSWGSREYPDETSAESYFNHPGIMITAAAGDDGYGVEYPAASQFVTSVGGTVLRRDTSTDRGWSEVVWSKGFFQRHATGSGCSAYIAKPSWQSDPDCARRTDNDIAAVAQGLSVYDSQQSSRTPWTAMNGTSASSPIIAAVYALGGGKGGPGTLYQATSGLFDIVKGSDGSCSGSYLCTAGTGYDGPTGLGTPNGVEAFRSSGVLNEGRAILIYGEGDHGSLEGMLYLKEVLSAAGYAVTTGATLPADLSGFGSIWHYGTDAIPDADATRLVTFTQAGGGLYLTGERPCCEDLNSSDTAIVNRLVVTVGGVTVGGQGDVCYCTAKLPVNPTATGGATTRPFALTTWQPAAPGGMTNVGPDNVFAYYDDGQGNTSTVGAVWGPSRVIGGGRLAVIMDLNWVETAYMDATTAPQVAQDLALFLSGLPGPPATPVAQPAPAFDIEPLVHPSTAGR